jgi:Domain of unknown function (DUF4160)
LPPRISSFYGITIAMYFDEAHHGVAHFHAAYAEHRASVALDGRVIAGGLPRRAQELVSEWAALHRAELETNWDLARRGEPLASIAPLP